MLVLVVSALAVRSVADWLLAIAGIPAIIVLVLSALANLRDEAVSQGWIKSTGRLGAQTTQAAKAKITPVLNGLGLTEDVRNRLAHEVITSQQQRNPGDQVERVDQALLRQLQPWIRDIRPTPFRGLSWYVDTMGAVHQEDDFEPSLANILTSWFEYLLDHRFIAGAELLLVPKDGNPILGSQVSRLVPHRPRAVVVKGESDPARVRRSGPVPHETDFEGLRGFLDGIDPDAIAPAAAVALDDSVTSGRSLMSAITRFNSFGDSIGAPIRPIDTAVTLFRIIEPDAEIDPFAMAAGRGVRLHSLLAFNNDDLAFLARESAETAIAEIGRFKNNFACDASRSLP